MGGKTMTEDYLDNVVKETFEGMLKLDPKTITPELFAWYQGRLSIIWGAIIEDDKNVKSK